MRNRLRKCNTDKSVTFSMSGLPRYNARSHPLLNSSLRSYCAIWDYYLFSIFSFVNILRSKFNCLSKSVVRSLQLNLLQFLQ